MRCSVRVGERMWSELTDYLLGCSAERMAYVLARAGSWQDVDGVCRLDLLAVTGLPVPDSALVVQSRTRVEIDPAFTREVLIACYESVLSLVDIHTHPFATGSVCFSGHDVANMRVTHAEFLTQMPDDPPVGVASLVLGQDSLAGSWTDPLASVLRPITSVAVLGAHSEEVELCS